MQSFAYYIKGCADHFAIIFCSREPAELTLKQLIAV